MNTSNILITEKQLKTKIKQLALKISEDYSDEHIVLIGILNGAAMFMMDLCRYITIPVEFDFMSVKSYKGLNSSGQIKIIKDISDGIKNKHVIIVEDIYETGLTLKHVREHLLSFSPASIKICVLLTKQNQKKVPIKIDYQGFEIPDKFVVGYGLSVYRGRS